MDNQFGEIIRTKREALGLTQEQLAERIGKSPGYIGQLERGLSLASVPTLKLLINELSLDANLLFREKNDGHYQFSEVADMFSKLDEPIQAFIQDSIRTAFQKKHS